MKEKEDKGRNPTTGFSTPEMNVSFYDLFYARLPDSGVANLQPQNIQSPKPLSVRQNILCVHIQSTHIMFISLILVYCWSHPQPSSRCHWIYPHFAGLLTSRPASQEPVFSSSPEPDEWPTAGLSSFHRSYLQHPLKKAPNKRYPLVN